MSANSKIRPFLMRRSGGGGPLYETIYSLRNMGGTYAIQIRRTSDNATLDVGFSGGDLNELAIAAFSFGVDSYVTKIYNQGINSLGKGDLEQPTPANQPSIYQAGSGFTRINGKAVINFSAGSNYLETAFSSSLITENDFWLSNVIKSSPNTNTLRGLFFETGQSSSSRRNGVYDDTRTNRLLGLYAPDTTTRTVLRNSQGAINTNQVIGLRKASTDMYGYIDGTQQTSTLASLTQVFGATNSKLELGRQTAGGNVFTGYWGETVLQNNSDATEMGNLITDQKSYFGI